jgi:hypothetical protein
VPTIINILSGVFGWTRAGSSSTGRQPARAGAAAADPRGQGAVGGTRLAGPGAGLRGVAHAAAPEGVIAVA